MDDFHASLDMACLHRLFMQAPKETGKATARLLNDEAFSYKELAQKVIAEKHTIRDQSFLRFAFRVEKSDPVLEPSKQRATAGSIKTDRFTGWIEDVTGTAPSRDRILGANARGGDMQAKAKSRLMPDLEFEKPGNYDDIPEVSRITAMISILARNPDYTSAGKGMFIITGGNWVPGLYKFNKGQTAKYSWSKKNGIRLIDKRDRTTRDYPAIQRVQTFGKAPKSQRYDWPDITIARLMVWFKASDIWAKYFGEVMERLK
jgi:hypothetical protein